MGGNIAHANQLIHDGVAQPEDFKLVVGCERFKANLDRNSFEGMERFLFADGSLTQGLCLAPAMFGEERDDSSSASQATGLRHAPSRASEDDADATPEAYDHEKYFHQNVIWAQAMRAMGEPFADFAALHPAIVETVQDLFETPTGPFDE